MAAREPRTRILRVAIVDDHQLVLDGLAARITSKTDRIDVVSTHTSWASLMAHPRSALDVVVLDFNLDDSIPIAAKLRALATMGAAAVIMSRHSDAGSVGAALRAGALAFVPKTESAGELITAIRSAAQRRLHVSESLAGAVARSREFPESRLGGRERLAILLFAGGRSVKEVALEMETTEETVKSYIKRARRKYRALGIDVGTRILLRQQAAREGWMTPE